MEHITARLEDVWHGGSVGDDCARRKGKWNTPCVVHMIEAVLRGGSEWLVDRGQPAIFVGVSYGAFGQ